LRFVVDRRKAVCARAGPWHCQHLANANKFAHIRRLHAIMALHVPALVTPLELMENSTDQTR
jgi:hypothetical protein